MLHRPSEYFERTQSIFKGHESAVRGRESAVRGRESAYNQIRMHFEVCQSARTFTGKGRHFTLVSTYGGNYVVHGP